MAGTVKSHSTARATNGIQEGQAHAPAGRATRGAWAKGLLRRGHRHTMDVAQLNDFLGSLYEETFPEDRICYGDAGQKDGAQYGPGLPIFAHDDGASLNGLGTKMSRFLGFRELRKPCQPRV